MNLLKLCTYLMLMSLGLISFSACQSGELEPKSQKGFLNVYLTDDPGDFQEVNIDIQAIEVKMQDSSSWYGLQTQSGIYDLLLLQNNVDTLLAADSLPNGIVQEIRLILGPDNTIMRDSILFPLKTPSAQQSGLKIKLQQLMIQDSLTQVTLDFDAGESVVEQGNGQYSLKPVIRVQ